MTDRFRDRTDAGIQLAAVLERFRNDRPIVLGLARGGVGVAAVVAEALSAPFDVAVVRKIAPPGDREYGVGAVEPNGKRYIDGGASALADVDDDALEAGAQAAEKEVFRRLDAYPGGEADVEGKFVLLVDDGLASGVSATAAARYVRSLGAKQVVLAVPVADPETLRHVDPSIDEIVALQTPEDFKAVADAYESLDEATDAEVCAALEAAKADGRLATQ